MIYDHSFSDCFKLQKHWMNGGSNCSSEFWPCQHSHWPTLCLLCLPSHTCAPSLTLATLSYNLPNLPCTLADPPQSFWCLLLHIRALPFPISSSHLPAYQPGTDFGYGKLSGSCLDLMIVRTNNTKLRCVDSILKVLGPLATWPVFLSRISFLTSGEL